MPARPLPHPAAPPHPWLRALGRGGRVIAAGLLALAAALAATGAAQAQAIVTILDGSAVLLRGTARLPLAEGLRLAPQDIVETPADTRLVRIEFPDGQAMSLGPATRLWIEPKLAGEPGRRARSYLLRGWVKLNAPPAGTAAPGTALSSPAVDLIGTAGGVVASVQDATLQVFAETGDLSLQERQAGTLLGSVQRLRSGEFLSRSAGGTSSVSARPPAAFITQVPRSFLDTLPARAALFKGREVPAPPAVGEPTYAELQDWLAAEPALRRPAMARWRPLARNPVFRNALVARMPAHPEWDRVLFPEKYAPKPAAPGGLAPPR